MEGREEGEQKEKGGSREEGEQKRRDEGWTGGREEA